MSIIQVLSWIVRNVIFFVVLWGTFYILTNQLMLVCPECPWPLVVIYQLVVLFSTFMLYSTIGHIMYIAFIDWEYERLERGKEKEQ